MSLQRKEVNETKKDEINARETDRKKYQGDIEHFICFLSLSQNLSWHSTRTSWAIRTDSIERMFRGSNDRDSDSFVAWDVTSLMSLYFLFSLLKRLASQDLENVPWDLIHSVHTSKSLLHFLFRFFSLNKRWKWKTKESLLNSLSSTTIENVS